MYRRFYRAAVDGLFTDEKQNAHASSVNLAIFAFRRRRMRNIHGNTCGESHHIQSISNGERYDCPQRCNVRQLYGIVYCMMRAYISALIYPSLRLIFCHPRCRQDCSYTNDDDFLLKPSYPETTLNPFTHSWSQGRHPDPGQETCASIL